LQSLGNIIGRNGVVQLHGDFLLIFWQVVR
jgi:hypothetical protein